MQLDILEVQKELIAFIVYIEISLQVYAPAEEGWSVEVQFSFLRLHFEQAVNITEYVDICA